MDKVTLMALETTEGDLNYLRLNGGVNFQERVELPSEYLPFISMEGQLREMMKDKEHYRPFMNSSGIDDDIFNFNDNKTSIGNSNMDEWAELLDDLMYMDRFPTYPKPSEVNEPNRMFYGDGVEYFDPRDIRDGQTTGTARKWRSDGAIANVIGEIPFFTDPREWLNLRNTIYDDKQINFDDTFRHMLDNGVWVLPEWGTERDPESSWSEVYGLYDIWDKDERFVGPIFFDSIYGNIYPSPVELIDGGVKTSRNVEIVYIQGWVKVPYVANATYSNRDGFDYVINKLDEKILSISEMVAVDYDTGEYLGFIEDLSSFSAGLNSLSKFIEHPFGFPIVEMSIGEYKNRSPQIDFNRRLNGSYYGWSHFGFRNVSESDFNWIENSLTEGNMNELNSFPFAHDYRKVTNLMYGSPITSTTLIGNTFPHYISIPNGARTNNELIQTTDYIPNSTPEDLNLPDINIKPDDRPEGDIQSNFFYTKAEMMYWEGGYANTFEYDGTSSNNQNVYSIAHGLKSMTSLHNRVHPALSSNEYNPDRFTLGYLGANIDWYVPDSVNNPKFNQWRIDSMDFIGVSGTPVIQGVGRFIPTPDDSNLSRLSGSYVHVLMFSPDLRGAFGLVEVHFNDIYEPTLNINHIDSEGLTHHAPFQDNYNYEREAEVFNMFNPRVATKGISIYHMDKVEVQRMFLSFWETTWSDWKDYFLSNSTDGILNLRWFYGFKVESNKVITQEGGFTGIPEPIRVGEKLLTHKPLPDDPRQNPEGTLLDYEFYTMEFTPFVVPRPHLSSAGGSPHSTIDLYLPFYGYYKLDVDSIAGEVLFVKYVISIFTGIASIRIYQGDHNISGDVGKGDVPLREYPLLDVLQAEVSVDIPIDTRANETFTMKVANSMMERPSMLFGPVIAVSAGIGAAEAATTPSRTDVTRAGGLSPEHSILAPLELRLLITKPKYVRDRVEIYGKPSHDLGKLSDFTSGSFIKFSEFKNVETSGDHKYTDEIFDLLKEGVYL